MSGASLAELSDRDRRMVRMLCDGFSVKQIASELGLCRAYTKRLLGELYVQMGVKNGRGAIACAFREGIVS